MAMKRNDWWFILGITVGTAVAVLLSKALNSRALGWGVGETITALAALLFIAPPEKRTPAWIILFPIAAGVAMGLMMALAMSLVD